MSKYIILALVVLLLAASSASYYYEGKYQDTKTALNEEKLKSESLTLRYNNLVVDSNTLDSRLKESSLELRRTQKYLESMAGREATLVAKPKLVEKLIQKAVREREERLECITGGLCAPL